MDEIISKLDEIGLNPQNDLQSSQTEPVIWLKKDQNTIYHLTF